MPEELSSRQGQQLLKMARAAIAAQLPGQGRGEDPDKGGDDRFLKEKRGVFVTLHKAGQLRGCIGTLEPVSSIGEAVCENARFAAFRDSRFSPLAPEEFDEIDLEVSVLSKPKPLVYKAPADLPAALVPGLDGVVLKKGGKRATFLPQVWDQLPSARQFLSHLCMKAGLAADAWETGMLDVSVYRVQLFEEGRNQV